MGSKLSGLGSALYDSKRREFLGRDGARWAKLGIFYFFFYLGLAGFFCAMLGVFMAVSPRDQPRYVSEDSRMRTRSNPLSPGLGFRPQPDVEKNTIFLDRTADKDEVNVNARNIDQYLAAYYSQDKLVKKTRDDKAEDDDENENDPDMPDDFKPFSIRNPGECTSDNQYGYTRGRPCVLVKMNKIVDFEPMKGVPSSEKAQFHALNCPKDQGVPVNCYGEYPADVDNIGNITYISENGDDKRCGSLGYNWFPYKGKYNRKDFYQAPYIWVQFTNPKPNVLINVICRIYGQNIDFDKKAGRALTRIQLYVKSSSKRASSRKAGEV